MIGPVPLVFSELITGDRVAGLACLWSCELRRTRQGKPFLRMELRDETSSIIPAIYWDADPNENYECPVVVVLEGSAGDYQGSPQIIVNSMRVTREDVGMYLPGTYRPREELIDEFSGLIDMIGDEDLRSLVNGVLEASPGFWTAPAAIRFHGAYRGGLLEHTLNVMRICLNAADVYGTRVNPDLLIATAALHDIGKADAYDGPESRQPLEHERLLGHIIRGVNLVERVAADLEYDGEIPLADVLHPIISHHGELEYGAPVKPGTAEALILSGADTLEADTTGYFDLWRDKIDGEAWAYANQRSGWVRRPAPYDDD
jgi:3'-5' exoribonuclease